MTNHSQNQSAIPAAERIGLPGSSARTETILPDGWVDVYARLASGAIVLSAVALRSKNSTATQTPHVIGAMTAILDNAQ